MVNIISPEPDAPAPSEQESGLRKVVGSPGAKVKIVFVPDLAFKPVGDSILRAPHEKVYGTLSDPLVEIQHSVRYYHRYLADPAASIDQLLSHQALQLLAHDLLAQLGQGPDDNCTDIILFGHGYGGLICEQAFMLTNESSAASDAKFGIRGMLLMNTPHFQSGLAEWAIMAAKWLKVKSASSAQKQDWSKCKEGFDLITEMQTRFAKTVSEPESQLRIACCFARIPDPHTGLSISSEWCVLPRVQPILINADHFGMCKASKDLDYAIELVAQWVKDLTAGENYKNPADQLALKSLAGSSRANDPAWQWDPNSATAYFLLKPKPKAALMAVELGDVIKSTDDPHNILASKLDVLPSLSPEWAGFSMSQRIKNTYPQWKNIIGPAQMDSTTFDVIIREEWLSDRGLEYVKAALQLEKVRKALEDKSHAFYVVTGVLRGATNDNTPDIVGFRCTKVAMKPLDSTTSPTPSRGATRLVVEEAEARSMSDVKKSKTDVTERLLPEIGVGERLSAFKPDLSKGKVEPTWKKGEHKGGYFWLVPVKNTLKSIEGKAKAVKTAVKTLHPTRRAIEA